ncbi:MAG: alanyl-tRNA synthetase, partial [Abditibacteriota bacterium]|nr:alanyl-tRNA synthetase [Abditibacteriota bacterium]
MQPLVPYFKGEEEPPSRRLASCQKCCRTDDFDQVGVTWRHGSFFEMLGNFSFGDYFKREAIVWAWEFLTKDLNIDPKLLWVSVYHDDPEAPEFWKKDVGLSDDRIYRFDKKDNWWGPVGRSGPCGPDSEIFFDRGPKYDTGDPELDRPGGDGDRYGELWNLVFQQYNQLEDGTLCPLPAPGIDTGMGLERTAAVLQGVDTIHHTDLFAPIINAIAAHRNGGAVQFSLATPELDPRDPQTRPLKVIADHVRAATFMTADGIIPGNSGRDYMLRRLIRRAVSFGRQLDYHDPFLYRIVPVIVQGYGDIYPELRTRQDTIVELIRREEERFGQTLEAGTARLDDLVKTARSSSTKVLSGREVFHLYETFGFPREMTAEALAAHDLSFDEVEYQAASEQHSTVSGSSVGEYQKREFGNLESTFVGYHTLESEAQILAARQDGDVWRIVLDRTPFYAESGGQTGDTGTLVGEDFIADIVDTQKQGKAWLHVTKVLSGTPREGLKVTARVDAIRRQAIARAHSATHLLHAALRQHLGTHVEQRGSLVEPDRLRFDFVHFSPIESEELAHIEDTVAEAILKSLPIEIQERTLDEARKMGAMALFGEKYGDVVRTVKMGEFSLELCGGTHLQSTSAAGAFRLVAEGGVGANLRRVEALTGLAALRFDRAQEQTLKAAAKQLGATPDNVPAVAEKLRGRVRELERQIEQMQQKMAASSVDELLQNATETSGVKFAAARAPQGLNAGALRELADRLGDKLNGVVVLAAESDGKVLWAVKATKGAVERGAHAGNLVRELAKFTGGGGGGRPDFAQAGGKDTSKIDEALQSVASALQAQIK